jgi:penicillin amidase
MSTPRQRTRTARPQSNGHESLLTDARRAAVIRWLRGDPADDVAHDAGVTGSTLRGWTRAYFRSKLPHRSGSNDEVTGLVTSTVRIRRDNWGIAHIQAQDERDLFFGLGYAMAQDRLWQLDYQRRLVRGELSAVLGPRFLDSDRELRTIGIGRIGDETWEKTEAEVRVILEALAAGIDRWTESVGARLPVEFELLGYTPRPWSPADSIAIWKHRWWTLTGRLDLSVLAETAQQILPPDLAEAFAGVELADETIVYPTEYAVQGGHHHDSNGPGAGAIDEGSNNWTVGGRHTTTGAPILCSDPHNTFGAPSQWFEAQLTCASFDAAGAVYIGTPGLYLGRNSHVAWGLTNHMISVRDLYREEVSPTDPNAYRDGDTWRPFAVERQTIAVAGQPEKTLEIRHTVRGPVVNTLLPRVSDEPVPPISLRWIAAEVSSGFEASFGLLRARSASDVRDALRAWPCPPLNYVYADRNGDIGYHAAGFVPRRARGGYGLRQANDPADAWDGLMSFDDLPNVANPERGWVATANNVPWTRDPWYLVSGGWSDGYRAHRIRERLTAKPVLSPDDIAAVHADSYSVRARDLVPALLQVVDEPDHPLGAAAYRALRRWNYDCSVDSIGASIWTAFWVEWCLALVRARFPASLHEVAATKVGGVARRLLLGETLAWFGSSNIDGEIRRAYCAALDALSAWGGPDVSTWRWGKLHQVTHPHPIGATPFLRALFDTGPYPTSGGGATVRAAGFGLAAPFNVMSGSTYRFVADLSRPDGLSSVQTIGQSGHLGSLHYRDQTRLWLENRYHPFWMSDADVTANLESETVIVSGSTRSAR